MKRLFITLVAAFATLGATFANIPGGSTFYIDCSQEWCCAPCILLHLSSRGETVVMQPVPGYSGVYSYTVSGQLNQDQLCFGKGKTTVTSDFSGWFGDYVSANKDVYGWTSAKPYYIVTGSDGSGYWAAKPVSSGVTALDKVELTVNGMNCLDSTYSVDVKVYFTGAPCALKITDNVTGTSKTVTTPSTSPYEYTFDGLKEPENVAHKIKAILYGDLNATSVVGEIEKTYNSPAQECTEDHGVIKVCDGENVTLTASVNAIEYEWSTGDTTRSITVPVTAKADYTVRSLSKTISSENNLMANGDFETVVSGSTPPPGFTSDLYYAGFDPHNIYNRSDLAGKDGVWCVTHNSNYTWEQDYANVGPHSGNYFGLFDAKSKCVSWKASTADNSSLVLIKDSTYIFSYWVANINTDHFDALTNLAILQFQITYDDNGTTRTQLLGSPYTLTTDNDWHYQEALWKAPCNSSNVSIAVLDLNPGTMVIGNDFGLDDIMFQLILKSQLVEAKRDIFHVEPINCAHYRDTVCVGEEYMKYGYSVSYNEAGDYTLSTGDTVYLHVEAPVEATFTVPAGLCDFEGGTVDVSYTVSGGSPTTYSLTFSDPRFTPVTDAPLSGGKIAVVIPDGVTSGVFTVGVTMDGPEVKCPFDGTFELSLSAGIPIYAKWTDVIFVDNSDSLYVAYQWYCNGTAIAGANKQYLYDPAGLPGTYFVELTQKDGTRVRTCESSFDELQRSAELNPGDGQKPVYETRIYQVGSNYRIVTTIYEDGTYTAEKQIIR